MNGCKEEREHTRRVSLMRVGEAASLSSQHGRRLRWPLKKKQTRKKKKKFTDQHMQTRTEMLILGLWRHCWSCITQIAVRLLEALYSGLKYVMSCPLFKCVHVHTVSVSQCVPLWSHLLTVLFEYEWAFCKKSNTQTVLILFLYECSWCFFAFPPR